MFYFSKNIYVVGTRKKFLGKVLLMSSHCICFHGEMRKISVLYVEKSTAYKLLDKTCFVSYVKSESLE